MGIRNRSTQSVLKFDQIPLLERWIQDVKPGFGSDMWNMPIHVRAIL